MKHFTFLGTICPYKLLADVLMDDPTQWLPFWYPDLYHYLIKTPGVYSQDKMGNYKALQALRVLFAWVRSKCGICNIIIWKCLADV